MSSRHKRTEAERFELFMEKVDTTGPCWLWTRSKTPDGYGIFCGGQSKNVRAHRWSYEHFVGPIAEGLEIDHLCRVPACVHPFHLEAVTPQVNQSRGDGVGGVNGRKTHCLRGHEFTPENTLHSRGRRHCRACKRHHSRTARAALAVSGREGTP